MVPGLASMATFIDPEGINAMNIVWAFVGFAFFVSFPVTLFIFRDEENAELPLYFLLYEASCYPVPGC